MGSCCCCQNSTSKKIDQEGAAIYKRDKREYKLLLLGVGSSGKSTIVKQLQKIYGEGFDNEMFQDGTDMIRQNIILGIIKLLWVSEQLVAMSNGSNEYSKCKIDFNDKVIQDAIDYVLRYKASKLDSRANNNDANNNNEEIDNYPYHSYNSRNNNINNMNQMNNINNMNNISNSYNEINKMMENTSGNYNNNNNNNNNNHSKAFVNFELVHGDIDWEDLEGISQTLNYLWGLAAVKETFKHCNEFAFPDNMGYFFDEMSKIFSANYQASDDDLIQTRIRTTGIIQHSFSIPMAPNNGSNNNKNDKTFKMKIIDVGGQRNERKKWIHLFDSCTAVIFVAALNHYCSKLFEDETKNAMLDSLDLFEEIFGSKWFRNSEMILFLNKHDLFCQKLLDTSLSVCFADWQGPDYRDYSDFSDYKQRYIDNINNNNTTNNNNNNNNNNSEMHNRQQSMTAESESGIHNNQAVMQLSNKDSSSQLSGLHGNKSLLQYNRNNENNNDNDNDNDRSMIEYKVTEDNITRYDTNLDHFFDDPLYVECHRKALSFIAAKYDEIAQRSNSESPVHPKQLYTHITTATDVNVIERVFWDVQSILVRNNLRKGGLALSYP